MTEKTDNIFTVDLEDWFFEGNNRAGTTSSELTNARNNFISNTNKILNLLKSRNINSTFFILGIIADEMPDIIREIAAGGHEIACHGYNHRKVNTMSAVEFSRDLDKSVNAIKKACGSIPIGFRAPYFAVDKTSDWYYKILKEAGFKYDSSFFTNSKEAVIPRANEFGIIEVPLAGMKISGFLFPFGGGGYFRLYPYSLTKYLMNAANRSNKPVVFYIHPWELNTSVPHSNKNVILNFRQNQNIKKTYPRLKELIEDFSFGTILKYLEDNRMLHER